VEVYAQYLTIFKNNITKGGISQFQHRQVTTLETTIDKLVVAKITFREVALLKHTILKLATVNDLAGVGYLFESFIVVCKLLHVTLDGNGGQNKHFYLIKTNEPLSFANVMLLMRRKYFIVIALVIFLVTAFIYILTYFSSKAAALAGANQQNTFYQHKTIPVLLKNEILSALKYYPELKDTPIDFVFDPNTSKSIMLSQPVVGSFFRGQKNRTYVVKINPLFVMVHKTMPIQNAPKDVLIGWIGHELGHVIDYHNRSNWQMVGFGIQYISSDKYLIQAERRADTYAVEHGMGDYIIKTKNYILHNHDLPPEYIARIKRLYLSPQQILNLINELNKPITDN